MNRHRALRQSMTRPAVSRTLEALEGRTLFDTTPFNLAAGNLSQNWENAGLLSADDNWANVPSITGFNGAGLTSTNSVDPQTVLASDTPGVVDIDVDNAAVTAGYSAGGVAEFGTATSVGADAGTGTNTVAFQGSGAAAAPYLKLYLNATDRSAIRVRFDLIDLDTNAATANQPVALQYRVGNSGDFINVPGGFTPEPADIASGATGKTTQVEALLPELADGASEIQVRILTTNAAGNDQLIAVDNIVVSSSPAVVSPGVISVAQPTYTVVEGVGTFNVTFNRTGGAFGAVSADYELVDGTATSPDDFNGPGGLTSGTVNFANGQTTATITITVNQDQAFEGNEEFTVNLENPTGGATLGEISFATVTIDDDDTGGILEFNPITYNVNEAAGTVTLTVTRTDGTSGAISVNYSTIDGTATSAGDFTGVTNGVLNFAAGQESATITLNLTNDDTIELQERFTVVLSNAVGAALGQNTTATINITDNDGTQPTGLLINEVFIDPPSTNTPYQYVELRGTPNTTLGNVYLLVIEGDVLGTTRNPGQVKGSIDLTGATIGSNGLLMVRAATGFTPSDAATGVFNTSFFTGTGFQTGSLSFLLTYRNPLGDEVPAFGTDLDTDNAVGPTGVGTLELLPSNFTILDGVGTSDGNTNDVVYGAALPSLGTNADVNAADAIVRFFGNNTALDASSFYYGLLAGAAGNQTLTFDPVKRSANFPAGGIVTPGGLNAPVPTDTIAPTVVSAVFDPREGQKIVVNFSEDVGASIAAGDFGLQLVGATPTPVQLVVSSISGDGKTVTLTFASTGGGNAGTTLVKGNYQFTVRGGEVADAAGNTLAANATSTFGFLPGDFNNNGTTNFADLVLLAQNYNRTSGVSYATGDANYDGVVNFADLVILAQNYNATLTPAPVMSSSLTSSTSKTATKSATKGQEPIVVTATPAPTKSTPVATSSFSSGKRIA